MQHYAPMGAAKYLSHRPLLSLMAGHLGAQPTLPAIDRNMFKALKLRGRVVAKGGEIIDPGKRPETVYGLSSGWACSYKLMRNGSRQIIDFQLPGDIIGLQGLLFGRSDYNCCAVTRVELVEINAHELIATCDGNDRLASAVLRAASREGAIVAEHLVRVGRQSALARTAHFFLEFSARLQLLSMGSKTSFECPLTQCLIADALGLTTVHLNRVVRSLREMGLLIFNEGTVHVLDYDRLARLAEFDSAYLQ